MIIEILLEISNLIDLMMLQSNIPDDKITNKIIAT